MILTLLESYLEIVSLLSPCRQLRWLLWMFCSFLRGGPFWICQVSIEWSHSWKRWLGFELVSRSFCLWQLSQHGYTIFFCKLRWPFRRLLYLHSFCILCKSWRCRLTWLGQICSRIWLWDLCSICSSSSFFWCCWELWSEPFSTSFFGWRHSCGISYYRNK